MQFDHPEDLCCYATKFKQPKSTLNIFVHNKKEL